MPFTLFEVSWEVCNKVGGIHTVVSTKAKTLVERFGDEYVAIGPWLLGSRDTGDVFEEERGFEGFAESLRELGLPVRVGRWKIPGRPRTVLIEFSSLYARKNDILARLWEKYGVDSLTGAWDYDEPVLFGWAAGLVIERWCQDFVSRTSGYAVAQFHEWMTGSGLLYLRDRAPACGTVFTTHATILGRSLSHLGSTPAAGLGTRTPQEAADAVGVRSKHSMEAACAKNADVFTTVSEITAREAELLLGRRPDPLLPNGIDLRVVDELAGEIGRDEARARIAVFARRFLGRPVDDAAFLLLSGRYEFHNKGIDFLLEALANVDRARGREVVQFLPVPAGHSGLIPGLREPDDTAHEALGLSTHLLIDPEHDPIQSACARLGLRNARDQRVHVIQMPIYLHRGDGLLGLPYEGVLRAMDLSLFPSFYEPWGYTPEESLAVGVPTITTDMSGFGAWALEHGLGEADGVTVLRRAGVPDSDATAALAQRIERFAAEELGRAGMVETCRATASRTSWSELIGRYYQAFDAALELARARAAEQPMLRFRPRVAMPVAPAPDGRRPRLFAFEVSATVPPELSGLERLARNYSWSWDPDAPALFEEISPVGWASSGHNPLLFLRLVFPEDLAAKAADRGFVERVREVVARFEHDLAREAPPTPPISREHPVAYFSAEFGVHESLRIYSGGLGILAGDHLKSASDVGLPLVGIGLYYRAGYLRQRVTATGEQIALEAENDPRNLPLELVRDRTGQPIEVTLQLPSTVLVLRAWRVRVGRIDLYLLDANHEKNRPEDRGITHQLYGGDHEHRLRQEIVLGRGGVKLLAALGLSPSVFHINEGHAAFLVLERAGALIREQGLTFDEARELVRATTVFTTHTPVPAGHDRFGEDLMRRYFSDVENWLGVKWERFLTLGTLEGDRTTFNMTYLAMGFSSFVNGVSKLHGEVSRDLLRDYWPRILKNEVPVGSITNGVHLASWMHPRMQRLLGAASRAVRPEDAARSGARLDPAELWRVRRELRQRLLGVARANLERQFVERHDSPALLARMLEGLDEDALLLGFARRFAPYKRSNLILRDLERLRGLLDDPQRPMRVFFAGKAHPRDGQGLEILRSVVELTRRKEFAGKVFFLEDYDIELARALVQGVDVWLNNPVRTLEASGTSGMKAAANGAVNLSVPDGWWVEGFDGTNGWNVGEGRSWNNPALQDELDGQSIVQLLADDVLPAFFERDADGLPRRWLELCSRSLATIPPLFNTDRMVREYRDRAYVPLARRWAELTRDRYAPLRARASSHARLRKLFGDVSIVEAHVSDLSGLKVGDAVEARVRVALGELAASDVEVELLFGHSRDTLELRNLVRVPLAPAGAPNSGVQLFQGSQKVSRSGTFAYGLRVRGRIEDGDGVADELVLWA